MKKYLVVMLIFLLVGCGKINRDDYINYVTFDNDVLDKPLTSTYDVFKEIIKEDEKIDFPDFTKLMKLENPEYIIYNYTDKVLSRFYEASFIDTEDPHLYVNITVGYKMEQSFEDEEDNQIRVIDGQNYKFSKLTIDSENYYRKTMCLYKTEYTACITKIDGKEITNDDLLEYLKNF